MASAPAAAAHANGRGLGLLGVAWPKGDPGLVKTAAQLLGVVAENIEGRARRTVDAARVAEPWSGLAAYRAREEAMARAGMLTLGAEPLVTVARVIGRYAEVLEDAQSQLVDMADRAVELEQTIELSRAAATAARHAAAGAARRADQATAGDDPMTATACNLAATAERAAAGAADAIAAEAEEELQRLRRKAHRLTDHERKISREVASIVESAEVPEYSASLLPAVMSVGSDVMRVAIEDAKRVAAEQAAAEAARKAEDSLGIHELLDVIGTFDPTPLTDGANAVMYKLEGDDGNAWISFAAMAPYLGDTAKGARIVKGVERAAAGTHKMKSAYYSGPIGEDGIARVNGRRVGNHAYAGGYHPDTGVPYSLEGFPIFKKGEHFNIETQIDGMTGDYPHDASLANNALGFSETPAGFTWHHVEDGRTMQLVRTEVHRPSHHTGGAAIIRDRLRQSTKAHP